MKSFILKIKLEPAIYLSMTYSSEMPVFLNLRCMSFGLILFVCLSNFIELLQLKWMDLVVVNSILMPIIVLSRGFHAFFK